MWEHPPSNELFHRLYSYVDKRFQKASTKRPHAGVLLFGKLPVESVCSILVLPNSMSTAASIPDLRPLSFSELLDRTFTYYRGNFWLFLGIMAIPQVFIVAMNMCFDAIQRLGPGAAAAGSRGPEGAEALGAMGGFFLGLILMVVLYWLLYSVALGATTFAISEVHLGRTPSARESYRSMKGRIRRIVDLVFTLGLRLGGIAVVPFAAIGVLAVGIGAAAGNGAMAGIAIILAFLGMIGGAVAAVWMILRYGLCIPALLLEKLTVKEAIRRSIFLTKGNLGRVFLVLLLMTLVAATVGGLVQAPFYIGVFIYAAKGQAVPPLWLSVPMNLVGGFANAVTSPLLMIGLALLYYDARVRKEGLDIQLIMDALDQPAAPSAESQVKSGVELEESSVLLTILLTLITFWLYYPVWFLTRRAAINKLRSPQAIGLGYPLLSLALYGVGILFSVWGSGVEGTVATGARTTWDSVAKLVSLAAALVNLSLCFKVRRILLDHSESQHAGIFASNLAMEQQSSFSSLATFFFGIFYLQYKINGFVEEWKQPVRSATQSTNLQPS